MGDTYEGYWYRSHQDAAFVWQYGLFKENTFHQDNTYDDDVDNESHVDDRVADKDNEQLLMGSDITRGIYQFLEVGMKYRVNIAVKENRYILEIENI